ncbi:MAG: thioredoxin family protein [Planctomycetota bacterium]|nr:thioredoxin family protein [Planctomycetota bacterium]
MSQKVTFYHAGCPVCVAAENKLVDLVDTKRFEVELVHLGADKGRIAEAEGFGVKSVPALVMDGTALHINFGADIAALK